MPTGFNDRPDYTMISYFAPYFENGNYIFKRRYRNIQDEKLPIYRQFMKLKEIFTNSNPEQRFILIKQINELEKAFQDDYQMTTVLCECGRNYVRKHYSRHIKSHLHKEFLQNQKSGNEGPPTPPTLP